MFCLLKVVISLTISLADGILEDMSKKRLFPKLEGTKLEDFEPTDEIAELSFKDTKIGEGEEVPEDARVKVNYTGALAKDGTIFQSSHDMNRAISFGLNEVIKGWQQGVPGMKVGGTRRIFIPSEMAYGSSSPAKNIPKNSDLVFDIELLEIL